MADTSTTLVFIRTHPLFLADTSTLGLGCTHSVLGRHMWHFSLQLHTHPVLGRHQCQVSLQSDSPSTLADTSVRSVFSQTCPPLWQTPVSGQSSVRLALHFGRHQCQVSLQSDSPSFPRPAGYTQLRAWRI